VVTEPTWDEALHLEVATTIEVLEEALYIEESGESWPADVETPSGQPYDGCLDCQIREILTVAAPRIIEAYQQGLVE